MAQSGAQQTWRLDDGDAHAAAYPYTFWKPSPALIEKLKPGDFVKLIFLLEDPEPEDPNAERMWVEITERNKDRFQGTLDNQPAYISGLEEGAPIEFEAIHIIDASIDDPIPDQTLQWQPRCIVTRGILYEGEKIGYLYREAPDHDRDSGWRFLSGVESDEYLDNSENVCAVSLGAVLRCDDRMIDLLGQSAPVAYLWDANSDGFIEIEPAEEI